MKQLTSFFNLSIYLTLFSVIFFAYEAYSSNLSQQNLTDQDSQATLYLQCYPLNPQNKEQCIQKLDKYVPSTYKADSTLYKQFVYDMERLGFANFLTKHGKECQKIDAGPIYSETTAAYEVHCINKEQTIKVFYMQFDYDKDQWSIIDTE
jgi:hypothetical protein